MERAPASGGTSFASVTRRFRAVAVGAALTAAARAATLSAAPTLNGASVPISQAGGTLRIGGAKVVQADVGATNGIIHVIDAVLIP